MQQCWLLLFFVATSREMQDSEKLDMLLKSVYRHHATIPEGYE